MTTRDQEGRMNIIRDKLNVFKYTPRDKTRQGEEDKNPTFSHMMMNKMNTREVEEKKEMNTREVEKLTANAKDQGRDKIRERLKQFKFVPREVREQEETTSSALITKEEKEMEKKSTIRRRLEKFKYTPRDVKRQEMMKMEMVEMEKMTVKMKRKEKSEYGIRDNAKLKSKHKVNIKVTQGDKRKHFNINTISRGGDKLRLMPIFSQAKLNQLTLSESENPGASRD